MKYVLDTNIITALLKANRSVKEKIKEITIEGDDILINGISYYEIKRGLLAVNATNKLKIFDHFCEQFGSLWLDTQSIFDEAAKIYADLKTKGELIEDADILIASTVKNQDFILVSDDSDFDRVQDLRVENWLN